MKTDVENHWYVLASNCWAKRNFEFNFDARNAAVVLPVVLAKARLQGLHGKTTGEDCLRGLPVTSTCKDLWQELLAMIAGEDC